MTEAEPEIPQSPRTPFRSLPVLPLDELEEYRSRSAAPSPEAVDADELEALVAQHLHLTRHIPYETDLRRLASLRCALGVIRYNIAKLIGAEGNDADERVDRLAERIAYEHSEGYWPESDDEDIDTENFWSYRYSAARDDSSEEGEEQDNEQENAMRLEGGQWAREVEPDPAGDAEDEVKVPGERGQVVERIGDGGAGERELTSSNSDQ